MFDFLKSSAPAYQNLTPAQFTAGPLPGAVNIEVTSPDFAQRIAQLDPTRPTYVPNN